MGELRDIDLQEAWMMSVDPGDPAGICLWSEDGEEISRGQTTLDGLVAAASHAGDWWKLRHVVYEDFRLLRSKALQQSGSRFETAQTIGVLKLLAAILGAETHRQGTDPLTIAPLWTGEKLPSNHKISHEVSAFFHGYYWLVGAGIVVPDIGRVE